MIAFSSFGGNTKDSISIEVCYIINTRPYDPYGYAKPDANTQPLFYSLRDNEIYLDIGNEEKIDIAFVTLNKSDKDYSPSTMYQDYSVGEEFFHWQSQSTTSDNSPTGQRYIHHREKGTLFLLFVRENKTDRISGGSGIYTFLGKANYVQHEGSRPMSILWKLERPIPARLQKKTNELIGG